MPSTAKRLLGQIRKNPVYHVEEVQGVRSLEPFQKEILDAVAKYPRVAVRSCHDMGKTFTAAAVVVWFTSVFEGAKAVSTAPTARQVRDLLWAEIRNRYVRAPLSLGGEMLQTRWKIRDDWFAVGYTAEPGAATGDGQGQASSMQGYHGRYVLVVIDEATGVDKRIWDQIEGLLTSGFVRLLVIGNPTTKACEFFHCFSDPSYKKIHLTCFDSPNFKANGIHTKADLAELVAQVKAMPQEQALEFIEQIRTPNPFLLTVQWVLRMVLRRGMDHPLVLSKAFGEFPEEDQFTLIPLAVVEAAQERSQSQDNYNPTIPDNSYAHRIAIGVDVARFGGDKTVITMIKGSKQTLRLELTGQTGPQIAGVVINIIKALPITCRHAIHVAIDATGVGSGTIDSLREAKSKPEMVFLREVEIRECHFGGQAGPEGSEYRTKYVNLKARIFVVLAEDLKTELAILPEDIYLEELPTIQHRFDSKGRYQIESKDEYIKRTGRDSPDSSDSLALANYARYNPDDYGEFSERLIQKPAERLIAPRSGILW